jgi:transcriptional regulator with XRE-family HTH domain
MPLSDDDRVREKIKAWIASTGVTQAALAERIGRNQAWMSRYLGGEFAADLETLHKMARAFNHSLAALLDAPTDPIEAKLIEAFRALPLEDRATAFALLESWSRSHRRGRKR